MPIIVFILGENRISTYKNLLGFLKKREWVYFRKMKN
tara:strand:+ start:1298 stop:1408 length:111 start_codon:yes stop_codon:yes gene_type:complete